jgi:hypothetical protein
MHDSKDLNLLLEDLQVDARKNGFELVVEPSNDKDLFVLANSLSQKAVVLGLTEINYQKVIVSYSISLQRYGYYRDEGFDSNQMSDMPIRDDIFDFILVDKIIEYLKK